MKIAIDSYCYHRYFGEVYPELERAPQSSMTLSDFLDRARAHGVDGVSVESFMLGSHAASVAELRQKLDQAGLERVWAWGHPNGLESGTAPDALHDLERHVDIAEALGARVMRICAGGRRTRSLTWPEHRKLLVPLLEKAADYAAEKGVTLAIENHIDLLADEMLELITTVDHPALGVCLDTANNLRMFEDPVVVAQKLAPYVRAVHVKDVAAFRGSPRDFSFWPSVPLGRGLIDLPRILAILKSVDYRGLLALEIDYLHPAWPDDETAIVESLAFLRNTIEQLPAGRGISRSADHF